MFKIAALIVVLASPVYSLSLNACLDLGNVALITANQRDMGTSREELLETVGGDVGDIVTVTIHFVYDNPQITAEAAELTVVLGCVRASGG